VGTYRLPSHVEARILALLDAGARNFGQAVTDKYAKLIIQAMEDVADLPDRPGTKRRQAIDATALFYHLRYSRHRLPPNARINKPRHILVYQIGTDGVVDILGLIPDMIPEDIALLRFMPERFE